MSLGYERIIRTNTPDWRDDLCLSMRNGRFPIIDITQKANGDTVILTGDGVGNMLRYTFTEC